MMSLLTSEDRALMRENFARVVEEELIRRALRRLPAKAAWTVEGGLLHWILRRLSLGYFSAKTGVSVKKLTGQDTLLYKELVAVVDVLWPGMRPSEVPALWPWGVGAAKDLRSLVSLYDVGSIAPVNN